MAGSGKNHFRMKQMHYVHFAVSNLLQQLDLILETPYFKQNRY